MCFGTRGNALGKLCRREHAQGPDVRELLHQRVILALGCQNEFVGASATP